MDMKCAVVTEWVVGRTETHKQNYAFIWETAYPQSTWTVCTEEGPIQTTVTYTVYAFYKRHIYTTNMNT